MRTQTLLSFLFESPLKFWKEKQTNLSQEQLTKAKGYFEALTGQLKAYISGVDLTELKFETIELLYISILEAKNFGIGAAKGGNWLAKQIDNNPSLTFKNVKEDYIPVLVSYNKNLKKPEIKDINLDNVSDIQQLNSILNSLGSEICIIATEAELGKVTEKDGWEVFLPHTTEASIVLGKRYCGKRDNTWCTTREDGENLFLNYAIIDKVALFYVIKKGQCADRRNPEYKMSVGFVNGEPKFNMGSGNITVDAANQNLTFERFQQVLGEELADEFLEAMKQRMGVLGNEPPALKEIEMLVATPEKFKKKFEGYKDDETGDAARKQIADFALKSSKTKLEVINYLATYKDSNVRQFVAENPNTPEETLIQQARDKADNVRYAIAQNRNAPEKALIQLSNDLNEYVRRYVAENPNIPEETLIQLSKDTDEYVRAAAAENPKLPVKALARLTLSSSSYIRSSVAKNPNTPEEVLEILAKDKDSMVRQSVAQNPNTPEEALIKLSKDKDEHVRQSVAQHPDAPKKALEILANSTEIYVLMDVAANPNTPEETLIQLSKGKNGYILQSVANNPNTPEYIIIYLLLNPNKNKDFIRRGAAINPNTPAKYLNILAKDEDSFVRQNIAQNPNAPKEALIQLSKDEVFVVRESVAKNPNTPVEALKILANDPTNYIKSLAIQNAQKRNIPLQESKVYKHKIKLSSILF